MNVVLFFLTRADVKALPRAIQWCKENKVSNGLAFANAHLALPDTPENTAREMRIEALSQQKDGGGSERLGLELAMQKEWMNLPKQEHVEKINKLFAGTGFLVHALNDTFFGDRIVEMLTKLRPFFFDHGFQFGKFTILFPSQIAEKKEEVSAATKQTKKTISPEQRAKMAAGAKARWAKLKAPAGAAA